jgi:hypothetical protein
MDFELGYFSRYMIAMGWTAGVRFLAGAGIFFLSTVSRLLQGPTQPPVQWVPWKISPGVKQPLDEAVHSPASNSEIKSGGAVSPLPDVSSWCSA